MSDLIRDSFTQFHAAISKSYETLNHDRVKIEDRKAAMLSLLENGITIPVPPSGGGEYQTLCRDVINNAEAQIRNWQSFIKTQIERSDFVNRHEKSILTLVFADVNAGKSSLGNFVGGWNLRDTPYADLYIPHDCEIENYSSASKEDRNVRKIDHFKENVVEATSTIQYYTLAQGLTWVDTPGLHSLTTEHGDLAKEYIQFADLVVYLTPSSSPFKTNEREMLGELFRMGKPVILAITKSDITEEDEIDGNIVYIHRPKSDSNRQTQEHFVSKEVKEISNNENLENTRVLSLSVKLARKAVETQDANLYKDSNLGEFLTQMSDVLSEKAIELKMRRPKAEISAFIDRLIGADAEEDESFLTVWQLRSELAKKLEELENLLTECRKEKKTISAGIAQMVPVSLSRLFRSLRDRKLLGDSQTVSKEMSEDISKLAAEICGKTLREKLGSVSLALDLPNLNASADGVDYQVQYITQVVAQQVERAPKGFWENVVHFINKDAKFYKTVKRRETIAAGDNFSAFLDAQTENLRREIPDYVSGIIERMASDCIDPLSDCYRQLDRQLEQLTEELEKLRFTN